MQRFHSRTSGIGSFIGMQKGHFGDQFSFQILPDFGGVLFGFYKNKGGVFFGKSFENGHQKVEFGLKIIGSVDNLFDCFGRCGLWSDFNFLGKLQKLFRQCFNLFRESGREKQVLSF